MADTFPCIGYPSVHRSKFGTLQVTATSTGKDAHFVPLAATAAIGGASLSVSTGTPIIQLGGKGYDLVLTPHGYRTKKGALTPYGPASYKEIGQLLKTDLALKDSLMRLRSSFNLLCYEHAALSRISPPKAWMAQHISSLKKACSFGQKPSTLQCTVEEVVETVEREVKGWIESVFTVAEQAAACEGDCVVNHPPQSDAWGFASCTGACAVATFEDIVTRTWGVIDRVTDTVVTEVIHCSPLKNWPTPAGLIELATLAAPPGIHPAILPPVVKELVAFIKGPLMCLAKGSWSITKLGDLKVKIAGVDQIPVALTVCLDQKCTDTLRDFLIGANLILLGGQLLGILVAGGAPAVLVSDATLSAAVTAIAAALSALPGITVTAPEVMLAILVILLDLVYHGLAVGGQIVAWEVAGQVTNGVCISHPSFPIGALAVINPLVGLLALAQIPCIVTPQ